MTDDTLELSVSNDLSQLPHVREAVDNFGIRHGLPFECVFGVKLALCELLANTISYGYKDHDLHVIRVQIELRDGSVYFEIMDDGIAFDPTRAETHSQRNALKDLPTGGYGVHLTRSFVDTMRYSRKEGRNHVIATKRICGRQS